VITGYALTFASLLIIGGRLGDVYGHRRIFIIGAALFGLGSLVASISQSVPQLVLGEAIIEGVGAALMMPATLAILSGTFHGRERATAFATSMDIMSCGSAGRLPASLSLPSSAWPPGSSRAGFWFMTGPPFTGCPNRSATGTHLESSPQWASSSPLVSPPGRSGSRLGHWPRPRAWSLALSRSRSVRLLPARRLR